MHGKCEVIVNIQQLLNHLVRKLRRNHIKVRHAPIDAAGLKAARIAEVKPRRRNVIFDRLPGFRQLLKRKPERLHCTLIEILMQDTQPFLPVKTSGVCADIV